MQHLDEGTIHSWLDGALSAEEAVQVEAHVKECRECAATVAEARGFIAASSRILTALDSAPRGVIPAAAPIKRRNWVVWRAAAAVLVVAGGSLVVIRNTGRESKVLHSKSEATESSAAAPAPADSPKNVRMMPEPALADKMTGSRSRGMAIGSAQPNVHEPEKSTAKASTADAITSALNTAVPTPEVGDRKEARAPALLPNVPAREGPAFSAEAGGVAGKRPASPGSAAPAAALAAPSGMIRIRGASALSAPIDSTPLKVVGTPRRPGAKVTLYEVSPGDTVTLTEFTKLSLEAVVVTGVGEMRVERQGATEKSAAAPSRARIDAANKAADSQRAAAAVTAPAAAQSGPRPVAVDHAGGVTTISWVDAANGNELRLSGRMPVVRLQQVKIRIERERAATAAARKTP